MGRPVAQRGDSLAAAFAQVDSCGSIDDGGRQGILNFSERGVIASVRWFGVRGICKVAHLRWAGLAAAPCSSWAEPTTTGDHAVPILPCGLGVTGDLRPLAMLTLRDLVSMSTPPPHLVLAYRWQGVLIQV